MNWQTNQASLEITRQNVKSSLAEWGDAEYQTALWTAKIPDRAHDPVEAGNDFYDSAVLLYFAEGLEVFSPEIDSLLQEFSELLDEFDVNGSEVQVLADERLVALRHLAQKTLFAIVRMEYEEWYWSDLPDLGPLLPR